MKKLLLASALVLGFAAAPLSQADAWWGSPWGGGGPWNGTGLGDFSLNMHSNAYGYGQHYPYYGYPYGGYGYPYGGYGGYPYGGGWGHPYGGGWGHPYGGWGAPYGAPAAPAQEKSE